MYEQETEGKTHMHKNIQPPSRLFSPLSFPNSQQELQTYK